MAHPILLQNAVNRISSLFSSTSILYGRDRFPCRAMRADRIRSLVALLTVMVKCCLLQENGAICIIDANKKTARATPLSLLARMTKISCKTANRCIKDLKDLELIEVEEQIKKSDGSTLGVNVCIRRFTDKFWEMLGLLREFRKAVEWAKKQAKYVFKISFKKIILKKVSSGMTAVNKGIKNIVSKIGGSKAEQIGRQAYLEDLERKRRQEAAEVKEGTPKSIENEQKIKGIQAGLDRASRILLSQPNNSIAKEQVKKFKAELGRLQTTLDPPNQKSF